SGSNGNSDADGVGELVPSDDKRGGGRPHDAFGDRKRLSRVRHVRCEDCELISAQPGYDVDGPHGGEQPSGYLRQQFVTARMPELVIDRLELVPVHVEHGETLAVSRQTRQGTLQILMK